VKTKTNLLTWLLFAAVLILIVWILRMLWPAADVDQQLRQTRDSYPADWQTNKVPREAGP
jgi:hypothetical protein